MLESEKSAEEVLQALGLARPKSRRRRKAAPSCEDCFFHRNVLCALDLAEPCPTFRPDSPDGLVPPRQPALLVRQAPAEPA